MKLDVEGFEPRVLAGAAATLRRFPPRMILTEYTPGVAERRPTDALRAYPASLQRLAAAGYSIWHLVGVRKGALAPRKADWADLPLPALRVVTKVRG